MIKKERDFLDDLIEVCFKHGVVIDEDEENTLSFTNKHDINITITSDLLEE